MKNVRELAHKHFGKPAIVLGGGLSLPDQARRVIEIFGDDIIRVSANQHGLVWGRCDYVMAVDRNMTRDPVSVNGESKLLIEFGVPVVSPKGDATYRIDTQLLPGSGIMGCWLAWVMGCAPIIACGMDCYEGDATYFHDHEAKSTGHKRNVASHLERWKRLRELVGGKDRITPFRSMGAPLDAVFPRMWRTDELATPASKADVQRVLDLTRRAA